MNRCILLIVLAGWVSTASARQSGTQDFRVVSWRGGTFAADTRLGLNLSGPASAAGTYGGLVSTATPAGAGAGATNPAALARLETPRFDLGVRWSVSNRSFGIGPGAVRRSLRNATDDLLDDYGFDGTPIYADVRALAVGQPSQLASVSAAWPFASRWTVGIDYQRLLDASMDLGMTGTEVQFDASRTSGSQAIAIDLLAQLAVAGSVSAGLDAWTLGTGTAIGGEYGPPVHLGASIVRFDASAGMDLRFEPQAMLVLSGSQQYFFNDPLDPNLDRSSGESNRLYWRSTGRYEGAGWGARAGLEVRGRRVGFSLVGAWNGPLHLHDPNAFSESWLPRFVQLGGVTDPGPDDDALLDVERIVLARPNLTRPTKDSLGTRLTLRLPSSVTLGTDVFVGRQTLTLNASLYSGELSAAGSFGDRTKDGRPFRIGKRLDWGLRAGVDLRFPDRLGGAGWLLVPIRLLFLDIDGLLLQSLGGTVGYRDPHYRISVGIVGGDAVADVERNIRGAVRDRLSGTLPILFSLGRSYALGERIEVGVSVFGLPELALRTSVGWRLP